MTSIVFFFFASSFVRRYIWLLFSAERSVLCLLFFFFLGVFTVQEPNVLYIHIFISKSICFCFSFM